MPVGLLRSVRLRRALWVAAELTRPRLRRRRLAGLCSSSASGWRQTDASGPAGCAGAIARRGRRRCRRICSSCSAKSPEGWGDARLSRGRARRSSARASRLRFRVALRFRRSLAPRKARPAAQHNFEPAKASSMSHQRVTGHTPVSHQSVINQSPVSHHSVITQSSLSHSANSQSSVSHQSVISQSSVSHQSVITQSSLSGS